MIARIWKAQADKEKTTDYAKFFENTVLPELRQIMGFRGAYVMEKPNGDGMEIEVMTLWETMDAVREFAGDNFDQAVVEPGVQAIVRSFDKTVSHHEILVSHLGS